MKIKTKDEIVLSVLKQEELMDAVLYIEASKRCLQDEIEDQMLKQLHVDED